MHINFYLKFWVFRVLRLYDQDLFYFYKKHKLFIEELNKIIVLNCIKFNLLIKERLIFISRVKQPTERISYVTA